MTSTKKNYFILFNITIWVVWGITIFIGVIPETPVMLNKDIKAKIAIVFPNRWPFFTKDSREEYFYILKRTSKGYDFHENFPNSTFPNAFGLINYQRAIGLEYGVISSKIDDDLWNKSDNGENLFEVLKKDTVSCLEVRRSDQITQLVGEYIFVKIEPLPYRWRNEISQFNMPCKFVKIRIK